MRHYSLNQLSKMKHISDYLYDEDKNFTPERLITDLGLYEGVLIDTEDIDCEFLSSKSPHTMKESIIISKANVSKDVKALHKFLLFGENIMLPCAECRRVQVFSPEAAFNPQMLDSITTENEFGYAEEKTIIIPLDHGKYSAGTSTKNSMFDPFKAIYCSGKDEMSLEGNLVVKDKVIDTNQAAISCVEGISQYYCEIRYAFVCSLNKSHHVTAYYTIHKATDVCKKEDHSEEYEKLKYCLVLEKVGQEPSMADLQMFDIEKYKKILSKESFRDFSMALGLYASGVGCGSLLYLRRIFENIVKNAHDKCSTMPDWDEEEYNKIRHFNDKIEYLEALGAKIIPDELLDVKAKIYGWLSKGVHKLTEQESMELFPYLKYAIELVLDEQITQKEKEAKLNELRKKLNK